MPENKLPPLSTYVMLRLYLLFRKRVWYCKICGEQRETWKKSGAWFFKVSKFYPYYHSKYISRSSKFENIELYMIMSILQTKQFSFMLIDTMHMNKT